MIASLQSVGDDITYDALMKRVARASVEDSIAEIRIPKSSAESEVSSKKYRQAANTAVLNVAIVDLVAARKTVVLMAEKG